MKNIYEDFKEKYEQFQYCNQFIILDEPDKFENEFKVSVIETIEDIQTTKENFEEELKEK